MLSWPYLHLLINHFPVVLSVSALAVTLLALLLGRSGLWLTAMGALTAAGVLVYPVFFTGGRADHALNDPWYIAKDMIDAHDNAAKIAMIVTLIAGAFAAYSWWRSLKRPAELIPGKSHAQFADTVPQDLNDLLPNGLANYLFELANAFHAFDEACPVLKAEEPARATRLALCELTARILQRGLELLGIGVPERM